MHSRLPRGVRPRLEGKPRTPLSSRVATRVSWRPLSGLKGVQPPLPFGERTQDCKSISPGINLLVVFFFLNDYIPDNTYLAYHVPFLFSWGIIAQETCVGFCYTYMFLKSLQYSGCFMNGTWECVCVLSCSLTPNSVTPWTVAR